MSERYSGDLRDIASRAREDQGEWPESWTVGPADVDVLLDELRRLAQHVVELHSLGVGDPLALSRHANRVLDETAQQEGRPA